MAVVDLDPLVAKARDGDRDAFDRLVRLTYGDVYSLAVRLTGNDDDASDVVQEAYVRAFRGLRRFRGDAAFSTWLYRIATNCALTLRTRRNRLRCDELTVDLVTTDPDADPCLRAEASSLRLSVDRALQRMPTRLRDVFVLREVYDLSHREIADRLGISESATKVRLHRARQTLRRLLHLREDDDHRELADPEAAAGTTDAAGVDETPAA
jgi:RNA polymerase sigma-70 factor (ECF subfamily)